ncbi:MAG TPA: hypothetical protein VMP11_07800 [Verrucomicrobiae bacterium]|nr:hypothetical protein [Verrucomicrobiae bacterium]
MNHTRIAVAAMLAASCVCFTTSGQAESASSKKLGGSTNAALPQVRAVLMPGFAPTNYDRIAIVCIWPSELKAVQAGIWEQTIDDEFTPALMQKGYDVPPADAQSSGKSGQGGNSSKPDIAAIGKSLDVPAVMVIDISNIKSELYSGPATTKSSASAGTETGTEASGLGTVGNAMVFTNVVPKNQMPGQAGPIIGDIQKLWGKPNPPQTKPAAGAKPPPAKPAAPQYANSCSMSARLYSVGDRRILWYGQVMESSVNPTEMDLSDDIRQAADAIAGAVPSRLEEAKK